MTDAGNRLRGRVAEMRTRVIEEEHEVPDDILLERVRARLGHVVSHPRAIEVTIDAGNVILSGPTLESEAGRALREIAAVPGVRDVHDRLERFESADNVSALQGGVVRKGRRLWGTEWMPAYRLFGIASSLPLLGYGISRKGAAGGVAAGLGASLLVRSITNMPLSKLTGVGGGPDVIELTKRLNLTISPKDAFTYLSDPEHVADLFTCVESLKQSDGNHWQFSVHGPLGFPLHCEVELTEVVPHERVTFKSVEGSLIEMEGTVRFVPEDDGSALDLQLHYNPPGGALGEMLATLLGSSLRHSITEDIPRIQRLIAGDSSERLAAATSQDVRSSTSGSSSGHGSQTAPDVSVPSGGATPGYPGQMPTNPAQASSSSSSRRVLLPSELKTGGDPSQAPESGDILL